MSKVKIEMKEVNIYQAVMITNQGVEVLRVSKSIKLIKDFIAKHRHQYIKDIFGWSNVEVIRGEDSYTLIRTSDKNFLCCWKIVKVICLEEEKNTEETAEN